MPELPQMPDPEKFFTSVDASMSDARQQMEAYKAALA